jgi:hypothetical protein
MNPPLVVIHGNSLEHVTDSYKRYLEGRFASTSSSSARRCASRCVVAATLSTTRAILRQLVNGALRWPAAL